MAALRHGVFSRSAKFLWLICYLLQQTEYFFPVRPILCDTTAKRRSPMDVNYHFTLLSKRPIAKLHFDPHTHTQKSSALTEIDHPSPKTSGA